MNREMLSKVLAQFDFQPPAYDLYWRGESLHDWELHAMTHESDGWHVFFAERGIRTSENIYRNEADACDEMLERVSKTFQEDRDWNAKTNPGCP